MKRLDVRTECVESEPFEPSGKSADAFGAPDGRSLANALSDVLERLSALHELETCQVHVELKEIYSALSRLPPNELESVTEICADIPQPLLTALEALPGGVTHAPLPRDIRTLATRLRCILELLRAHGPGALTSDLAVHYGRLDVAALLRRIATDFDALANARRVRHILRAPEQAHVEADPAKVETVLLNLVFNAFKHTPEEGEVRCELSLESTDELIITVSDSGPGVDGNQLDAIFDRSRLNDRSAILAVEGLGLSLAHSRDLVALHGGSLSLIDHPGPGATFQARLPTHAPAGTALHETPTSLGATTSRAAEVAARELQAEALIEKVPVERAGRPLILIVEPGRPIQRLLAEALEPTYATAAALDGDAGLRLALEHEPDLIIVDTSLPFYNGESLIPSLRRQSQLAHIPILALTPGHDPREQVRLLETGVQDLVHKPFLLQELYVRARNLVATKQTCDLLGDAARRRETDIVSLAEEVSNKQRELERAVQEVDVARELAENGNRVKSNFLRMVSHELKTPVTAMQLQMLVLERHQAGTRAPELQKPLKSIARSFRKLLTTVDTTIEWARIEAGRCRLSIEQLDLASLVSDVVAELADRAADQDLELRFSDAAPDLPALRSDAKIVRIVIINVLSRAVSFSEGGQADVRLAFHEGSHRVYVRDSGEVLAPQARKEIFEPIPEMSDLRWQSGQGSGLGLTVVRDIARAVRGDVWLDEDDHEQNTLIVMLPSIPAETAS